MQNCSGISLWEDLDYTDLTKMPIKISCSNVIQAFFGIDRIQ